MEKKLLASVLGVLMLAVLVVGTPTPPQGLCNMTMDGLAACRPAATKPNPAAPSAACCQALARADLPCLCSFKNTNPALMKSLGVDPELATQLPAKCGIPAPAKC